MAVVDLIPLPECAQPMASVFLRLTYRSSRETRDGLPCYGYTGRQGPWQRDFSNCRYNISSAAQVCHKASSNVAQVPSVPRYLVAHTSGPSLWVRRQRGVEGAR